MPTLFTRIVNREIPAKIVYEDDLCLAFEDIAPKAPTHVLLIPKKEIASLDALADEDAALAGHMLVVLGRLARQLGVAAICDKTFKADVVRGLLEKMG